MVLCVGTFGSNSGPSLVVEENTNYIWATWTSSRDANYNIYSNYYNGAGWLGADVRVCQNTAEDIVDFYTQASPGICYDSYGGNGRVWTAWTSNRDGNYNIYVANNEAPFDIEPPIFESETPAPNAQSVPLDTSIYIEITDDAWGPSGDYSPCGVNIDSLIMLVEGSTVINMNATPPDQYDPDHVTISRVNKYFTYGITYLPPDEFNEGDEIDVYLYVCDRGDNDTGNILDRNCTAYGYSFHVSEYAWPQFQHDTQHMGRGFFTAPDITTVKWHDEPGGYAGSPVIGVGDRVVFGSTDGFLNVLGANGAVIKRYYANSDVTGAPVLGSDGTIYFGTLSGKVLAIDSTDYSLKWQYQTGGPISAPLTITPAGNIIVASEDAKVYCFAPNSNLLWQYQTTAKIRAAPATDSEGNVYVATHDGKLFCLYEGTMNWVYPTPSGSPIESSPTISPDGTILFGSWDGNLYGVYKLSGELRDSYNVGTAINSSPAVDRSGNVYFGSGFMVYRLEWDIFTNNLIQGWIYTPINPAYTGYFNSSPCLSYRDNPFGYDSVYIGNNTGVLFQLDMNTGLDINIWDEFGAGAISTAPAIGRNNVLYVASGSRMYAFGPGTGNNPPRLTNGSCTPTTGNIETVFTYQVSYYDVDQDTPQVAYVYIDGSQHPMTLESGSAHNGIYTYSTTLLESFNHSYYFYFADGKGGISTLYDESAPLPSTPFDGPDVGNPQLFSGNYSGTCPALTYSVSFQDQNAADTAELFVDGVSGNMVSMGLPPTMSYSGSTPSGASANDYYCFKFTDIIGNIAYYPQGGGWLDGENCDDTTDPTWATFRGDRLRTGVSQFNSTTGADILWTFDVESAMFSSPIIDNLDNIYIGTYGGKFFSINSVGELNWSYEANSDISSTATMNNAGNIYFGTRNGKVYALSNSGSMQWTFQTGGSVYGSPAVSSTGRIYIGSYDSRLYCLAADGSELWNYQNPNSSPISFSSPCVGPTGLIYFGSIDGTMWAVKDNDSAGILQWTYETDASIESTPTVTRQGDLIFGSSDFNIYSLHIFNLKKNTESGLLIPELNWAFTTGDSVPSSAAVNGYNNIAIGSRDHHVYYLYPNGTKKWDIQTEDFVESAPVIDQNDNVILVPVMVAFIQLQRAVKQTGFFKIQVMKMQEELNYSMFIHLLR
jgi:outer membrane protein assembly factor BamB